MNDEQPITRNVLLVLHTITPPETSNVFPTDSVYPRNLANRLDLLENDLETSIISLPSDGDRDKMAIIATQKERIKVVFSPLHIKEDGTLKPDTVIKVEKVHGILNAFAAIHITGKDAGLSAGALREALRDAEDLLSADPANERTRYHRETIELTRKALEQYNPPPRESVRNTPPPPHQNIRGRKKPPEHRPPHSSTQWKR